MNTIDSGNVFMLTGRLAAVPRFAYNRDGSRTVIGSILIRDEDGTYGIVPFVSTIDASTVRSGSLDGWDGLHKGDLVHVTGRLSVDAHVDFRGRSHRMLRLVVQSFVVLVSVIGV